MKSKILLIVILVIPIYLLGPNRGKVFKAINNAGNTWRAEKYDKAIEYAKIIYDYKSAMYIEDLQASLNGDLLDKRKEVNIFLEQLYNENYQELNAYIDAIYLWSSNTPIENKYALITQLLEEPTDERNKCEFYSLLIIRDLDEKELITKEQRKKITDLIIRNLNNLLTQNKKCKADAENRFLLAYTYYYLSEQEVSIEEKESFLKLAAMHSPTRQDISCKRGYYTQHGILMGYDKYYEGFNEIYIDFLKSQNKPFDELAFLTSKAINFLNEENKSNLKAYCDSIQLNFEEHWLTQIENGQKDISEIPLVFNKLQERLDIG